MEGGLTDPNWRVGPDAIESKVGGDVPTSGDPDICESEGPGISKTQLKSSLIGFHPPNGRLRVSFRQRAGDWSVPGSDIEQVGVTGFGIRTLHQENLGAGVDLVCTEHSPVGGQIEGEVGEVK